MYVSWLTTSWCAVPWGRLLLPLLSSVYLWNSCVYTHTYKHLITVKKSPWIWKIVVRDMLKGIKGGNGMEKCCNYARFSKIIEKYNKSKNYHLYLCTSSRASPIVPQNIMTFSLVCRSSMLSFFFCFLYKYKKITVFRKKYFRGLLTKV